MTKAELSKKCSFDVNYAQSIPGIFPPWYKTVLFIYTKVWSCLTKFYSRHLTVVLWKCSLFRSFALSLSFLGHLVDVDFFVQTQHDLKNVNNEQICGVIIVQFPCGVFVLSPMHLFGFRWLAWSHWEDWLWGKFEGTAARIPANVRLCYKTPWIRIIFCSICRCRYTVTPTPYSQLCWICL